MKTFAASLIAGVMFGAGLTISGMTQADKVIDFLDLSDAWDPSLAFVMMGAIAVHAVLFRFVVRQPSPLFAGAFGLPSRTDIDPRLVGGSALFGIGWAVGGYCPGPGLVSSVSAAPNAVVFVVALTGGMLIYHAVDEAWRGHRTRVASHTDAEPTTPVT